VPLDSHPREALAATKSISGATPMQQIRCRSQGTSPSLRTKEVDGKYSAVDPLPLAASCRRPYTPQSMPLVGFAPIAGVVFRSRC
jgi:hypothetical protein